mgnify:CR=1 FL=1
MGRREQDLVELTRVSRREQALVELTRVSRRGQALVELTRVGRRGQALVELTWLQSAQCLAPDSSPVSSGQKRQGAQMCPMMTCEEWAWWRDKVSQNTFLVITNRSLIGHYTSLIGH